MASYVRIRVGLCKESQYEGSGANVGMEYVVYIPKSSTLHDLSSRILGMLQLDQKTYTARVHQPNDCKAMVGANIFQPDSRYEFIDQNGAPLVHAHVAPKVEIRSTSDPAAESDCRAAPATSPPPRTGSDNKPDQAGDKKERQSLKAAGADVDTDGYHESLTADGERLTQKRTPGIAEDDATLVSSDQESEPQALPAKASSPTKGAIPASSSHESIDLTNDEATSGMLPNGILAWEDLRFVRIGTVSWETARQARSNAIPLQPVVIGQVRVSKFSKSTVIIHQVDTWTVGGVTIGHAEQGQEIDDILNHFPAPRLDVAFQGKNASSDESVRKVVLQFVKGQKEAVLDDGSRSTPKTKKKGKNAAKIPDDEPLKLQAAPLIPWYAPLDSEPQGLKSNTSSNDILVVVCFQNRILGCGLDLETNTQGWLEHNDTCSDVREWVLNEANWVVKKGTLHEELDAVVVLWDGWEWEIEIWVLPQVRGSSKMYSWESLSDWQASRWLDADVSDEFGRQLYLEVRIVTKKTAKRGVDTGEEAGSKKVRGEKKGLDVKEGKATLTPSNKDRQEKGGLAPKKSLGARKDAVKRVPATTARGKRYNAERGGSEDDEEIEGEENEGDD